jgi:hypothetical protein
LAVEAELLGVEAELLGGEVCRVVWCMGERILRAAREEERAQMWRRVAPGPNSPAMTFWTCTAAFRLLVTSEVSTNNCYIIQQGV